LSPVAWVVPSSAIGSSDACGKSSDMHCPTSGPVSGLSSLPNPPQSQPRRNLSARNGCVLAGVSLFSRTQNKRDQMALLLRIPIHLYRWLISPLLHALCGGSGCGCRFHPSCSVYALDSLKHHGAFQGSVLSLRRIARCHPWSDGGFDPVPRSQPSMTSAFNLKP
jgi:putative membrane protein insertion efficiency factor